MARSISALLADSMNDKSDIQDAASDLTACRGIDKAVRTFTTAAASRGRLVRQIGRLDTGKLPGSARVVAQLSEAWTASKKADLAFAAWGRSMHKTKKSCHSDHGAQRRAVDQSVKSHAPKRAAARAWNPIATRYGLPTVAWKQL
ncbi:hypothetical protein [Nocardioides sp. KR10-350]|uniref:hypothetical protein n=1 Tax=Nocardioides cheoyonin TaxID=3156615 RepID=UPI0032B4119F